MSQTAFKFRQRGGKRAGAGRKPAGRKARVSHKRRARFETPAAVHVTLVVTQRVWNLRSRRCFRVVEACLADALGRFGLRVIEFTVLGNHLHLLVEADNDLALSRGMQGLNIRVAKALNRLMGEPGRVFGDHYHSRVLETPTELVNALAYVLGNHAHHFGGWRGIDPFSSAVYDLERRERVLADPRTWLLRHGWRRARRIPQWLRELRE
ncbi:MAG: transposase [Myxococcales bacterium]|nr:transposase [Myxococcales bacterium]